MPPLSSISPLPPLLLEFLFVAYLGAFVLAMVKYNRTRHRAMAAVAVALALGCATFGGLAAYETYQTYAAENTWGFQYSVSVSANGTGPESVVLPIPEDEGLLAGLRLTAGNANWSLVNTSRGRGLFVRFTSAAAIGTSVSILPRPSTPPDTRPTMAVSTNCTVDPSNCTGLPKLWIFYSGPSGASLAFSMSWGSIGGYLTVGWAEYELIPRPMPAA